MKKKRLRCCLMHKSTSSQFIAVMRLSFIMALFAVISASANADTNISVMSRKVSLDFNNTELREVLRSLEEQSGHRIIYSLDKIRAEQTRVSIQVKNVELTVALDELLKDLPYTYTINGRNVVIIPMPQDDRQAPAGITLMGRVTDVDSRPLGGVSVFIKGTREGISTDAEGRFALRTYMREGIVLRFSFVGKKDVEVAYTGQSEIEVRMENTVSVMEEVVVTGYQTIAREKVTGATTTITSDDLSSRYTTNILDNLEGKVAGLVNYNGNLTIRGTSTLRAESRPLLVVDGLPTESRLEDLNTYDIESVTVLKDAAAAAIYGARASNGIIVVTTKRAGERDKIDIEVWANITVYQKRNLDYADNFYLTPAQQVDIESSYYNWYYNEAAGASNNIARTAGAIAGTTYSQPVTPVQYTYYQLANNEITLQEVERRLAEYRTRNFAKEYARHALLDRTLQQYNIAVRNRTDNFQSNLVFNFKRDNAGIINTYDNQLNIFYKASYDMAKWLTVNFSMNSIMQRAKENGGNWATDMFNVPAYYNMFNDDGSYASHIPWSANTIYYNDYSTFTEDNPGLRPMNFNHLQELGHDHNRTDRQNLRYHGDLLFKVMEGLTVNTQFIYETDRQNSSLYSEAESFTMRWMRNLYTVREGDEMRYLVPEQGGRLVTLDSRSDSWTGRAQVNFNRIFVNDHSVSFLAGLEFREIRTRGNSNILLGWDDKQQSHATTLVSYPELEEYTHSEYFISGFPYMRDLIYNPYIKNFINPIADMKHRNASGYANLTYTFRNRYNGFVSIRKDYADVYGLATEFRGSPFWSVGASWNLDREDFMSGFERVNTLKIRMSYGRTGNIYQDATSYTTAVIGTTNRYNGRVISTIDSPGNPELSWERTGTFNVGLDFSLLDYRLRGILDWYNKKSDKIFSTKSIESTKGFTGLVMNMADVKNNGLELTLSYDWFRPNGRKDFTWTTSATAAWNKNKITRVEIQANTAGQVIEVGYKEGYPVSSLFSYVFAGLNEDGVQTWRTDDGRIIPDVTIVNESPESVVYSGQASPKHTYAMENHFTYNGFSLNLMMVYYGGHKMRALQVHPVSGLPPRALPGYLANAWTPDNTDTNVMGIGQYNATSSFRSDVQENTDLFVHPADFLKIRNIVFGYDLPQNIAARFGFANVSLRFQIDNPKYLWVKNDIGIDPETMGIRRQTSYVFGLNLRF